jgi:hypothetical protein
MKVVATQEGQYDQIFREVGEVFSLIGDVNDPGKDPEQPYPYRAKKYTPKKDKTGKVLEDEFAEEDLLDKEQQPIHVDFAEDTGPKLIKRGPKKGEVSRTGWMLKVPDHIQTGLYEVGIDFWTPNVQIPQALRRIVGQEDKRAAKIKNAA